MKKFAIVLSGSGVYDGSEIHEATLAMLAVAKKGAEYELFAPDIDQYHVINHLTGDEMNETRNVLIESARIARGEIKPLSEYQPGGFDGIIFPGGFGAAKNLSTFAFKGADCEINPDTEHAVKSTREMNKPIGALCIAPAVIAKILGSVEVTIGKDPGTAENIRNTGATHIDTETVGVAIDKTNKVVSTPCYMLADNIDQVAEGEEKLVEAMLDLAD